MTDDKVHPIRNREVREKLRTALDWLRDFLETMMGAPAYDEAAFQRQIRDLVGGVEEDEQPSHPDSSTTSQSSKL